MTKKWSATASILVALIAAGCVSPVSTTPSTHAAVPSQAAYTTLGTDATAWSAAIAAGDVRQGTVLVKTASTFDSSVLVPLGATQTGTMPGMGGGIWRHLAVPVGNEAAVISQLRRTAGVMIAEPELRHRLPEGETIVHPVGLPNSVTSSTTNRSLVPSLYSGILNDPYVASAQYNIEVTKAVQAYATGSYPLGSKTAYAAVIDTGLNFPHQDFFNNGNSIVLYAKSAFTRQSATAYTYVGDGSLYTITPSDMANNWDDDGHGTHVTGIVAAVGNNSKGIAGAMWSGLKLISYKVITENETDSSYGSGGGWAVFGSLYDVAQWWATASNHTDSTQATLPVNMSLGGSYASAFETEILAFALARKVVVVAAMGNDGRTTAEYPGAYTGVIAVGATMSNDQIAPFSTTGSWISVTAPGYDIISTYNGSSSDYEYLSGTSMAAPFVTGLAAYTLAYSPSLLPDQLKTVLMSSADLVSGSTGFNATYGAGRVDVLNTLSAAVNNPPSSGSVYSSGSITVSVTVAAQAKGDIPVYLYDSTGAFVAAAYTGADSYGTVGSVSFWLLKPGTYTAKANDGSSSGSTSTITLSSSGNPIATITLTS